MTASHHFASLTTTALIALSCAACSIIDGDSGGETPSGDTKPSGPGRSETKTPPPPASSTTTDPEPKTCAAPPATKVSAPVELLVPDIDFFPQGALVDGKGRPIAYGWAHDSGIALPYFFVARFTPAGAVDTSFGENGYMTFDDLDVYNSVPRGFSVTVDAKDRIVFLWERGVKQGSGTYGSEISLVRVDADGSLDATFGDGGYVESVPFGLNGAQGANPLEISTVKPREASAVTTTANGDIYAFQALETSTHDFSGGALTTKSELVGRRVRATGAVDASYSASITLDDAITPIVSATTFADQVYVGAEGSVHRLTSSGAKDPSFALTGIESAPQRIAFRKDGTGVVSAGSSLYSFSSDGKVKTKIANVGGQVALRCDGRIVVGTPLKSAKATMLLPDGSADAARDPATWTAPPGLLMGSAAGTIDPLTGSMTAFYYRPAQGSGDALVAVRLQP